MSYLSTTVASDSYPASYSVKKNTTNNAASSSSSSNNSSGNQPQSSSTFMTPNQHRSLTTIINYSNKPPSDLSCYFKCFVLTKNGKKCRKKISNTYRVALASTKLLFVKDSKNPKLEFFIDFKGGKCYKVESRSRKNSDPTMLGKDGNNNLNKEKDKEKELLDLIGSSKYGFAVS